MNNHFIWVDLSTFDISVAKEFYRQCFHWKYQEMNEGYELCLTNQSAAGLYTMTEKFQDMNMPSFWMSYIHVQDIEQIVREAESQGAKVEVRPQSGPGGGRIALIRDPSGAGFTCYEGEPIDSKQSGLGNMVWNELHVSALDQVKSFYEKVFGWSIKATAVADRYEIFASPENLKPIAGIQVASNEVKGDKEYWGVYFSVNNLEHAAKSIERAGGEIVTEQPLGEHLSILALDSQGAAFYIVEEFNRSRQAVGNSNLAETAKIKWRALAGLALVVAAVLLEANWIWGIFFLLWVILDLKYGVTHFMERIERRKNPIVYWLIMTTWGALSIYFLLGV